MAEVNRRVLPGFSLTLGYTVFYLSVLVLIPLGACFWEAASLSFSDFWACVWTPRAQAAYWLTFSSALLAASINAVLGLIVAWSLVRYQFPAKRVFDALVDIPFALPTAVAGLVFANLYVANGWFGQYLVPLGVEVAYSRLGIVAVLVFTGFPFVVRTVQPVLESIDAETEEAAAILGANRLQTFQRIIVPTLLPAVLTGFSLAFARGIGEYGSVIIISGGKLRNEIAPVLIVNRLEENAYAEATAIAIMLLGFSFILLTLINVLERWSKRHGA
jgi:sulfate/thiosulfate transport system permease protein